MYKQTLCVTLPISAAVIIAAALFANAGDLDPPKGPIEPTMHTLEEIYVAVTNPPCCSPEPEDIRTYHKQLSGSGTGIIIPKVEGPNGFILTGVVSGASLRMFQDTGAGPVEILSIFNLVQPDLTPGLPLIPGSTITGVSGTGDLLITLTGYVY